MKARGGVPKIILAVLLMVGLTVVLNLTGQENHIGEFAIGGVAPPGESDERPRTPERRKLAKPAEVEATPEVFIQPTDEERLAAVGNLQQLREEWWPFFQPHETTLPIPVPQDGDWLAEHPQSHQSFDLFLKQRPNRPNRERGTMYLLPLDEFDEYVPQLEDLRDFMQRYFGMPTKVLPRHTFPPQRVTERNNPHTKNLQWLTSDVLRELKPLLPPDAFCMLGVTMTDLYPDPKWNFVFGQATFTDRVGIYSFARFDTTFWGNERSPAGRLEMLRRSCHLIAHETGHMFGIRHCVYYQCVMNGCNSQAESDTQPLRACPVCLRKLQWSINFDPAQRERELTEVYERLGMTDRPLREVGQE